MATSVNVLGPFITMGNRAVIYPFLNDKIAFFLIFKYHVMIVHRMVHNVDIKDFQFMIHVVNVEEVLAASIKNASEFRKKLVFTFWMSPLTNF
jgi:hypothetical protein